MKLTRNIHSLSTFKRDTAGLVRQMKKTKTPVVLTVNGKAELVVQDAGSYQKLLEAKDRMEAIAGIKRGLESMSVRRPDDTWWFVAVDFDQKSWQSDAGAFLKTCRETCVPASLERSRSGDDALVS